MERLSKGFYLVLIVLFSLLLLTGCPKKSGDDVELEPDDLGTSVKGDEVITSEPTTSSWGDRNTVDSTPSTGEISKTGQITDMQIVYFDFDKYNLRPDAIDSLQNNVSYLKANPTMGVIIEGHCDERGTNEYNMALGSKRASSCRNYLIANGISATRISVRSFGEERPVDMGHNELAWSKNRRAEFVVVSQ
ncbi:MAG: peptidoglycan-associated lipoprotein Pal [Acidobacteria bacterium]|nr:peptidoglycan-associated lipoprotein Pal [Acidobacteriota bacterium]